MLIAFVGGAVVLLAAAKVVAQVGPNIPGPPIRVVLGLDTGLAQECIVGHDVRRLPGAPRDAGWTVTARMPYVYDESRAIEIDRRVLLVGGLEADRWGIDFSSVATVDALDLQSGARTPALLLPLAVDHTLPVRSEGDLYVVGGYSKQGAVANLWRYRPATEEWTELPSMRVPRGALTGGVVDGRIYAVGGSGIIALKGKPTDRRNIPHGYATLEIYDIASGRWTDGPPMPTPRHHASAAVLDGKLYVAGGRLRSDSSIRAFERYDPKTNRWERLPPLPLGAAAVSVVALGRSIVATGGGDDTVGWVTPSAWAFAVDEGRWRRLPDLGIPRHGHTSIVHGGRLYAIGGSPCAGYGTEPSIESIPLADVERR